MIELSLNELNTAIERFKKLIEQGQSKPKIRMISLGCYELTSMNPKTPNITYTIYCKKEQGKKLASCTCGDYKNRERVCKHILAVLPFHVHQAALALEQSKAAPVAAPVAERVTTIRLWCEDYYLPELSDEALDDLEGRVAEAGCDFQSDFSLTNARYQDLNKKNMEMLEAVWAEQKARRVKDVPLAA